MIEDLSRFPSFDDLYRTNRLFRRLTDGTRDRRRVDLAELWGLSSKPAGLSPRTFSRPYRKTRSDDDGMTSVLEYRGRYYADRDTAVTYCQQLDGQIAGAFYRAFMEGMRADPARRLLDCPDSIKGLVSIFAVTARAETADCGIDDARRAIVKDAVALTDGMEDRQRETAVAKVQRAVESIRSVGEGEDA